ncbi:hypothetical protein [Carboxylicivirga marina]|uniref:hypothetical protein n=1 Tax=Carboxylicivirga marina TaxID=2800988 RepID=UPI00259948E5|nr:hypothetical protein [uncultured Carboxylicivirga sp.]
MSNPVDNAICNIETKLDWAIRSYNKMLSSSDDNDELKDSFWSFLSAFQTSWFYYNKLIEELYPDLSTKKRKQKSLEIINSWKKRELSESELKSWDTLQTLRNEDTHRIPLKANYELRSDIATDFNGDVFTDYDGTPFTIEADHVFVVFNQEEFSIKYLAENGIESIRKLMQFLPRLK